MAREMEPEPLVQHVAMSYMHDLQVITSHTLSFMVFYSLVRFIETFTQRS